MGSIIETASLQFFVLQFRYLAGNRISFPAGKAGNVLRGAFGSMLREHSCRPQCIGPLQCGSTEQCRYAAIFEPRGPTSRFRDLPRPFVFRADHLDGRSFETGETFDFELNLFDRSAQTLDAVRNAFSALRELGARRSRTRLVSCTCLARSVDLTAQNTPVHRIRIDFQTPTELKANNSVISTPEFGVLYGRAAERVAALSGVRHELPSCPDVLLTSHSIQTSFIERRSSKTGQRHRLGGFTGHAIYEGDLRLPLPVLKAAEFTGVGRHASWGNGRIAVTVLA